jgi:nitrate/TMAO reductase-like tetraheme cytochrome c subunit
MFPEITRKKQLLLLGIILAMLVPGLFVYNYTQNNPKFCTSCHIMQFAYDSWQESVHMPIECHVCHETNIQESLSHVYKVLTKNPQEITTPADVENMVCENCHTTDDPKWPQIAETAGHKTHVFDVGVMPNCIDCHGDRVHIFEPPEERCVECHGEELVIASEIAEVHCITCHDFLTTMHDLFPYREDCLECHDVEPVDVSFPDGAHSDTDCKVCHDPHIEEQHRDCVECHQVVNLGLHEEASHDECLDCHTPHNPVSMRENCLKCHEDKSLSHFGFRECALCHSFR